MGESGPARTTRPRDRKAQILAAAAWRFWEFGYHQTGMAEVAAAVGIRASALYRHFQGKQDLLVAVLHETVNRFPTEPVDLDRWISDLRTIGLDRREFSVLWDRDAGQLPEADRTAIQRRIDKSVSGTARLLGSEPLLRAHAVHAVVGSPSYHHNQLDRPFYERLLDAAALAVAHAELPTPGTTRPVPPRRGTPQLPVSRREALLSAAIRLFHRNGYSSVSLADIGTAIGVTGSSIYHHFPSKTDLLASALNRGNEVLWSALHHALAGADGPADALDRALASYIGFAVDNPEIVGVLLTEVINVPAEQRERYRRQQQEYVAEWVALLRQSRTELDELAARALVHAALAVTNRLARAWAVDARPALAVEITAFGRAVLRAPVDGRTG